MKGMNNHLEVNDVKLEHDGIREKKLWYGSGQATPSGISNVSILKHTDHLLPHLSLFLSCDSDLNCEP